MSKLKALTLSILFAVQAVVFYMSHNTPFMIASVVGALLFFVIWKLKHNRDQTIINQAQKERHKTAQISQSTLSKSSEGSSRLSLPPPLKEK